MELNGNTVSRRSFVAGGAVAAVGAATMLAGCGSSASSSSSAAASASSAASASASAGESSSAAAASAASASANAASADAAASGIEINEELEELKLVLLGKDSKIACIIVSRARDYYEEEGLDIGEPQVVSGGFPEAMPMLSDGTVDVLPFGSIPTCTYVGQGDDLVIFGGTVTNGSECVTLIENKDLYSKPEDFIGKKIGCFRMETGHMVVKSWLRENGVVDGKDVEFVLLESMAAEVAAVENGEVDMCFVNSGYGYVATQGGKCAIAFQPQQIIGHEFPCCRQSTNRKAFEEKKSALVKFEIANLRAMYDIANDHEGVIADIVAYSGQEEDYVEAITYGNGDYVAAMTFEMDPRTDDVKAFYGDMVDNGDIENEDKELIVEHLDSSIYKTALDTLIARGENVEFYNGLLAKYEAHNTLGV